MTRRTLGSALFVGALVAIAACSDARTTDEVGLDFPSQGTSGKEDAFGRKLLGIAAAYPADRALSDQEDALKADMGLRRAVGWAVVRRVLEPVPLLGLADGSAPAEGSAPLPPIPDIPRWQTWYGIEDIKRMFIELENRLGPVGRAERRAFSSAELDQIEAWNAGAADRSNRWPLERYLDYVKKLGQCPDDMDAEACARLQQSQFSGAAGGTARITYSPATVRHLLENYGPLLDCLDVLGELPLSESANDGNFTWCFEREMPVDAVLVKAQWVRADFGRKLPTFDTDAAALAARIAPEASADWTTPDRETDPGPDAIYTTRLKNGDVYRLAGLHVMTKELRHWVWTTLWWSDDAAVDFGADRPDTFGALDPVWSNYKMCVVVDYLEGDADPAAHFSSTPSLAAALAVPGAGTTWCSNPYVEHGRGNARTNCIGCHQHGGSLAGPDGDGDGRPDPFVLERVIDSETLFPDNGRAQMRQVFPTDYLWSTLRVDDVARTMAHEVQTFDALDVDDPDLRAARIVALGGDPERGGQIFANACARCHGPDGQGTIDAPSLFERVPGLDAAAIAKTLVVGKNGRMPAWGDRFDDQALADVVAYLEATFRTP